MAVDPDWAVHSIRTAGVAAIPCLRPAHGCRFPVYPGLPLSKVDEIVSFKQKSGLKYFAEMTNVMARTGIHHDRNILVHRFRDITGASDPSPAVETMTKIID